MDCNPLHCLTKMAFDLGLHVFHCSFFLMERIYGGMSEIMKTIIVRDLTGLRT